MCIHSIQYSTSEFLRHFFQWIGTHNVSHIFLSFSLKLNTRPLLLLLLFLLFFIWKTKNMDREEKLYGTHIQEGDKNPVKHDDGAFRFFTCVCIASAMYYQTEWMHVNGCFTLLVVPCATYGMVIRPFRQQHNNLDALSSWVIKDTLNRHRTWFSTSNACTERNKQNCYYMWTKIMMVRENPSARSTVSWVSRLLSFSSYIWYIHNNSTQPSLRYLYIFCVGWWSVNQPNANQTWNNIFT